MPYRTLEDYMASLEPWQVEIVARLRALLKQVEPPPIERIMSDQPVFDINGPCFYLTAFRDHVNFGVYQGAMVDDPAGLLEGTGKRMRHISIKSVSEITENLDAFTDLIYEAIRLNLEQGDPTRWD
jgi:hypothetical protein